MENVQAGADGEQAVRKAPEEVSSRGVTVTFHLSQRDVELLQRYLEEHEQDPGKWRKAARRYAQEGVYRRIREYLDAIIV